MSSLPTAVYIDSSDALREWLQRIEDAPVIGVDTESDSFFHYREKVCLIQMTALGEDALIDPLAVDVTPLSEIFADPRRIKIFHDAIYDLVCMRRDFGFQFAGLFDTMLATRMLGCKNFGLAAVLDERFSVKADKRWQRSNWARRPLSQGQREYAQLDTHFLPQLRDLLIAELRACRRLQWAEEEFSRLSDIAESIVPRPEKPSADGFWRIRGVKNLSPAVRGRVRALYMARERLAERLDRPPFKIFGDSVLLDLAQANPQHPEELGPRPGLGRPAVQRFGKTIIAALRRAKPVHGNPPPGAGRRRRSGRSLDVQARKRYELLRDLRKERAAIVGLDPEVLLGNAALEELARHPPAQATEVLQLAPEIAGWRRPLLVQPVLDALKGGDSTDEMSAEGAADEAS